MIPNDWPTATGSSPSSHVTDVVFSISSSAFQPSSVTANVCVRKTSAGPSAGERSTQFSVAVCGGAGIAGGGSPDDELQPETSSPAASASRGRREGGARPHRRTGPAARRALSPIASRPAWISTSTRARSSSGASGSPSPRAGSRRPPRRRARRPRSSAARSSSRRRCSPAAAARRAASSSPTRPTEAEERAARDPRPRHPRPRRPPALDRAGVGHREGVLPLAHVRPWREEAALHVHDAGRRGHRGGRGEEPRRARARCTSTRSRASSPWQARRLVYGAGVDDPSEQKQIAAIVEKLYEAFVALRRDALRDQPADRHAGRRGEGARLEVHGRRQRALPPSRTWRRCATSTPPTRSRRSRARRASPTSSSTARSGVLGNGAGLAMSTVDVVTFAGGRPANFCDLGGGGDAQGVVDALEVITRDPQVKSIFFNIFGGITRCDEVARGILQALDADGASRCRSSSGSTARTRRRAAAILAEAAPREPPRRADDARGCAARRGAGGVTTTSGADRRAGATSTPTRTARAPTSTCSSTWAAGARHRARRRDRRRPRRPPAARGGPRGRHLRPRARACGPTSSAAPRTCPSPTAASTSSPAARRAHHFDDVGRAVAEMARVAARQRAARRHDLHGRRRGGGREAARPVARAQLHRRRVARRSSRTRASRLDEVRLLRARVRLRRPGSSARGCTGEDGRARRASCSATGWPTAG